jgi:hypothetical protein
MRITVLGTRSVQSTILPAMVRPHTDAETVSRREIPYWEERGWVRSGNVYTGNYQTPYGAFAGMAEDRGGNYYRFYIFDPPRKVRWSSHSACFQARRDKGYLVHMAIMPTDVSSGIITIERLINEALGQ